MEEAVVYPDKLPIVSGGNSLWGRGTSGTRLGTERETNRIADCAAVVGPIRWDLMPGVSRPSPGMIREGVTETITENNGERLATKWKKEDKRRQKKLSEMKAVKVSL